MKTEVANIKEPGNEKIQITYQNVDYLILKKQTKRFLICWEFRKEFTLIQVTKLWFKLFLRGIKMERSSNIPYKFIKISRISAN